MSVIKIGVTGTRSGCNQYQIQMACNFLHNIKHEGAKIYEEFEFHHGDCIGVDAELADIAKQLGYKIVCHPPAKEDLRAFVISDERREPLSYFARNRNIVDETDLLMVVPYQKEWQPNGGTWYTHDYAEKQQKPMIIIYPEAEK